jgi:alanine-synthesizing transaminase
MHRFERIERLPPYVFNIVNQLKVEARKKGDDIIDLGMGNPDLATPPHIVKKLCEAATKAKNHRYSVSRGIYKLRLAICNWYKRNYNVDFDPEGEAIVTIGSKEGLSHLMLAIINRGDTVFVPNPTYPIHIYSVIIAGGNVVNIPLTPDSNFLENLENTFRQTWIKPKVILLSFPHNPTTYTVDLSFFEKVVSFARENDIFIIHDFAYADLVFDGYRAPSIFEVPGARDVAVEMYTLSKSYSMPGWRVGFCVGNRELINALTRIKSYLDYGMFTPIQIASIVALDGPQQCVKEINAVYKTRRDALVDGLNKIGWTIPKPKGTMFVWAKIPEQYQSMGSLEFSKFLITKSKVAISPGIGFGEFGDDYVRFALVENEKRIRQAVKGIKAIL